MWDRWETLKLSPQNSEVLAQAVLYPEYVQTFARVGTQFSVVTPEISAAGVTHLETLFQPYINVEPGKGQTTRDFTLQQASISDSRYLDGLNIVVDTPQAGSLQVGTPVLFRGIEVGTVTGMSLGPMADRVYVSLRISKQYQHLVRDNSVFWLASGYDLKFGLTGGVVKSGTFQQFIRGGIAFATPPHHPAGAPSPAPANISCLTARSRKNGMIGAPPYPRDEKLERRWADSGSCDLEYA